MSEKLGQLDLVFVVDNTGSMGPYIQQVKQRILEIIRTIKKEELCHRLRVGLVCYRDHHPEESTYVTRKYELTSDTARIERNVMEMEASGGGDGPEAVADSLDVTNRMEFLTEAAKVAVLIGDAPPHGVEEGDIWHECPDGISWEAEIEKAHSKGIVIHTVGCHPEIESYKNAIAVFQKIAAQTGGKYFPLTEAGLLVQLITGIAVEEIDKLAIQQSILEEMGASLGKAELPAEGEMSDDMVRDLAERLVAKGTKRRAVTMARPAATAAARAPKSEEVQIGEQSVSEDDIREAIRQLRAKSKK